MPIICSRSLRETIAKAKALDASVSVTEGVFALEPEEGTGQFDGCVLMADGRVFFVPGEIGGGSAMVRPHIWDPVTGSIHEVPWDSPEPDEYRGGVLLRGWAGVLHAASLDHERPGTHL